MNRLLNSLIVLLLVGNGVVWYYGGEVPFLQAAENGQPQENEPELNTPSTVAGLPRLVRIKSLSTEKYLRVDSENKWITADAERNQALVFEVSGTEGDVAFQDKESSLWLNYRDSTGAVKLYEDNQKSRYEVKAGEMIAAPFIPASVTDLIKDAVTIRNRHHDQYLWVENENPYISGAGASMGIEKYWVLVPYTSP